LQSAQHYYIRKVVQVAALESCLSCGAASRRAARFRAGARGPGGAATIAPPTVNALKAMPDNRKITTSSVAFIAFRHGRKWPAMKANLRRSAPFSEARKARCLIRLRPKHGDWRPVGAVL
jgi:hypothetical protein